MAKTVEESYAEILQRNQGIKYSSAFSVWNESAKDYFSDDDINEYHRWYDDSWTLPNHIQSVLDLYKQMFNCCKIVFGDDEHGISMHNHTSPNGTYSYAFTMCIPYELNSGNYFVLSTKDNDYFEKKSIVCKEYTRLFFNSSRLLHGVPEMKGRWAFIMYDFGNLNNRKLRNDDVDIKIITDSREIFNEINLFQSDKRLFPQLLPEVERLIQIKRGTLTFNNNK